eukprot:m.141888 g.141888  ORF g.141888 m.141888 type:complete len:690 (-) comp16141_c0_seq1:80-2149(-)
MCGIFGYLNHQVPKTRKEIIQILVDGLKRLEYRGYDSAGIAVDTDKMFEGTESKQFTVIKRSGKVSALQEASMNQELDYEQTFEDHLGIAHTRWATHGPPSEANSHPQSSDLDNEFVIIHNGIITNYKSIKSFLEDNGHEFVSDTDTEVVAKLIKYLYIKHKDSGELSFRSLVEETVSQLEGAFALIFKSVHFPNEMVAARRGSPLLIGIRTDELSMSADSDVIPIEISDRTKGRKQDQRSSGLRRFKSWEHIDHHDPVEYFLASDASAVIEHTNRVIFLEDDDVVHIRGGNLSLHHLKHSESDKLMSPSREVQTLEMKLNEIMKGNYSHFMLKEIFEQPESVVNTMRGRIRAAEKIVKLGGLIEHIGDIRRCRRLLFVACGTSYNSAIATRQFLEEMTELPVIVDIASDFLDRECPIFRDDVCFFISQSGETADTLEALRYCKRKGALIVGITNTVGSTLSRESDCGVHINAGPEIGVASTKAYTSQIITLILFGLMMSEDSISKQERRGEVIECLDNLPSYIQAVLDQNDVIREAAIRVRDEKSMLIMGRGYSFANCLEGALKIKELTYLHCEAILAGELKHGPLALIEESLSVIMLLMKDKTLSATQNALEQIVARGGRPLVICPKGYVPSTSAVTLPTIEVPEVVDCLQVVISVIPLQLLSYHIATELGHDVDCPRNLAKSVTVQ